jgi:SAM-dependent methyltransferase
MNNKEITKRSYEATAHAFAHNVAHLAPLTSIQKFVQFLPQPAKILDLGCGSGRDSKIFSEMGHEVIGIDFSSNLLEFAKEHAPAAHFVCMDIEHLSFPSQSFDGIWAVCSLVHIPKSNFLHVLKTLHTLLKTGGCCYIALKRGSGEGLEKDLRYGDFDKFWAYFEKEEIENFLKAVPFKVLEVTAVEKSHAYQTHQNLRIFCKKEE